MTSPRPILTREAIHTALATLAERCSYSTWQDMQHAIKAENALHGTVARSYFITLHYMLRELD